MNKSITLNYSEGASDKTYQASIIPHSGGYVVNFAYGRRGTTLQTGTKTASPVDYPTAERVFAKLVLSKKAKGYTEAADGTPYQHSEHHSTGILPQLLNPIDEAEAVTLLHDPGWCAQEKYDGRRLLVEKHGAAIHGINRRGLQVGLPSPWIALIKALPGDFVLDGEAIGDVLHAFDLVKVNGQAVTARPYSERLAALRQLLGGKPAAALRVVQTKVETAPKLALFTALKRRNAEGIVLKRLDAPYTPGRPNSGGPALKFKFTATASLLVSQVNEQRSVTLGSYGKNTTHGNVTIPPGQPVPPVGAIVEVRYLYAFRESGALFQPVYLGVRDDLEPAECTVAKLKFKEPDSGNSDEY